MVDSTRVGYVRKVFCLLADLLDYCLVVFVVLKVGLERDDVVDEDEQHVDDHGEGELVGVRVDHPAEDELHEQPGPVDEVVGVLEDEVEHGAD